MHLIASDKHFITLPSPDGEELSLEVMYMNEPFEMNKGLQDGLP